MIFTNFWLSHYNKRGILQLINRFAPNLDKTGRVVLEKKIYRVYAFSLFCNITSEKGFEPSSLLVRLVPSPLHLQHGRRMDVFEQIWKVLCKVVLFLLFRIDPSFTQILIFSTKWWKHDLASGSGAEEFLKISNILTISLLL